MPFRPGNGISIYEFFQRFEDWSRGRMSQDDKANVLYNRHLHPSIKEGNKELEDAKRNYPAMKSLLLEKWGTCDLVCDQYLEGIERVAMPSNPKDKAGMLSYVKNAYNRLITLTKLEVTRGQPVPGLEDYYLSNQFLKKVHRVLPEELGSQFLMKLQENGESYYLMKGRQYMDRMISLLRCCYKSLEIALEDYPTQQNTSAAVTAKPVQLNDGKAGSMSVNVFSMGVCPASCAEPPTGPEPKPPGERRRRRRRRRRPGIPDGIEEWVVKLEQELKQIKLQVAGQERRIAELEAEVASSKGKNQEAKLPVQRLLPSVDGADQAGQAITRGSTGSTGNPVPSFPDQRGQTPVPQPGRARKRRRPRRRNLKNKSVQMPSPDCLNPHSPTKERVAGENRRFALKPGSIQLAIQANSARVPPATGDQRAATRESIGSEVRIMKYTGLYAQKTPLNRAPCVAGVDPGALLQFLIIVEIWKTYLIPVLIWILQNLKN
jgi:hypothetical protein